METRMLLRERNHRSVFLLWMIVALSSRGAYAAENFDSGRQLIQLTGLDNILRTDAEQAGFIIDRLPEDLPPELRSDLRRVIGASLDYNKMEDALLKTAFSKLDGSTIELNTRWWASSSGREIAKAESSIYASLFGESTFEAYNPTAQPQDPSNAGLVDDILATGKYPHFVADLMLATSDPRLCLLASLEAATAESDCAQGHSPLSGKADQLTSSISRVAAARYLKVSAGDLHAYLVYLRSTGTLSILTTLRAAELEVEKQSWQKAMQQANTTMDAYIRSHFSDVNDAKLGDIVRDIDNGRNLSRARFTLLLMSRSGPNPAVLVQLARVTLKLAQDLTYSDNAPSVPQVDAASLGSAQRYIEQAMALDANRAETLMISGHIAYLQRRFQESAELLEKAKAMGGTSPWLHINLGDALWAMAMRPPSIDRARSERAAEEFEAALKSPLPSAAEIRAVHQLGAIYAELGDIPKADLYQRRYISMVEGRAKAYALHRYAHFLLFYAKDTDGALSAARQAVQIYDFQVGHLFLVQMLTIKAGDLVAAGRPNDAAPFLSEARQMQPDLESLCPELAQLPGLFPGVVGIHSAGAIRDFSGRIGGQTLVHASAYATSTQIEQLLAWGANPNYFDPDDGTPLHRAILADNVAAVETLLAHGANPLTPFTDGRLPSDLNGPPSDVDVKRSEILAAVRKAAGGRGSAIALSGAPFKVGYEYLVQKGLDGVVNGASWADSFEVGEHLVYTSECRFTDTSVACFVFKKMADQGRPHMLAIGKDQLVSWTSWFKEIGPERTTLPKSP
jgi:tetratricopeptide (TPR) repeat protein